MFARKAPPAHAAPPKGSYVSRGGQMLPERRAVPRSRAQRLLGWWGAALGLLVALIAFAPAAWLASWLSNQTNGRLQLAAPEGTMWSGSAWPVLTGGPGSRDAVWLPERMSWRLSPFWPGLRLSLAQPCCLAPGVALEWRWLGSGPTVAVLAEQGQPSGRLGQWPAAMLEGLGAPLNTLQPRGQLALSTQALAATRQNGRLQWAGSAQLDVMDVSSLLATVRPIGSYRLQCTPQPAGAMGLQLHTLGGAMQLSGQGQIDARGLHFRGQAEASPGQENALNLLLNIMGRRTGAQTLISIG